MNNRRNLTRRNIAKLRNHRRFAHLNHNTPSQTLVQQIKALPMPAIKMDERVKRKP